MDRTKQEATGIEVLEEILGLLRITKKDDLKENTTIEITLSNMLRAQILAPAKTVLETIT